MTMEREREREKEGRKGKRRVNVFGLDNLPVEETEGRRKERKGNNFCPGAREREHGTVKAGPGS